MGLDAVRPLTIWISAGVLWGLAPLALTACGGDEASTGGEGSVGGSSGATTGSSGATTGGSGGSTGGGDQATCTIVEGDIAVSDVRGTAPAIAYGGDRFAVAWTDLSRGNGDIVLTLFDTEGRRLGEQPMASGAGQSAFPSVTALPSGGYLVLWQDKSGAGSQVFGRRAGDAGQPMGAAFQLAASAAAQARPTAAASPTGIAIAWTDTGRSFVSVLQANVLGAKIQINMASSPALATSDDALGVVWVSGARLGFSKLTMPPGAPSPVMFRSAAGAANQPRITGTTDGAFAVTWEDDRDGADTARVFFAPIDASGHAGAEIEVPSEAGNADYPDIAWTGTHTAIAYYQFRDGPPKIYLSLFTADQTRVGGDLTISGEAPARFPRMARGGDRIGVAYAENDGPVKLTLVACP